MKLPRDMTLTGFNDQTLSLMTSPRLTTVDQNIDLAISTAAEVILSQLNAPAPAKPIIRLVAPELVVRESTGPARAY